MNDGLKPRIKITRHKLKLNFHIPVLSIVALTLLYQAQSVYSQDSTCSAGSYLKNGVVCNPCSPGYYCPGGVSTLMRKCSPGFYSVFGQTSCTICPAGFKCADPTIPPVACGVFQYAPAGSTVCTACPGGNICGLSSTVTQCKPGELCQKATFADKQPCPVGYYCPTPDIDAPIACPSGYYSIENSTSCTICPLGYYCPSPGMLPVQCPDGTYSSTLGKTACTACPRGYECSIKGQYPTRCQLGQISGPNSIACMDCPAASFCPHQEIMTPYVCPKGTFSVGKQSQCTICPEGYGCTDRKSMTACATGYYSTLGGDTCLICPSGFYCPSTKNIAYPCAPGQYSLPGQTSCTFCPVGNMCPLANQQPAICAVDEFQDLPGKTYCNKCPAGYTCVDKTLAPIYCGNGQYTDFLHQQCYSCPAGYDCSSMKFEEIAPCPRGSYSLDGSSTCTRCPEGYFCEKNTLAPVACADGSFAVEGSTYCTLCPPGYNCLDKAGKYKAKCLPGMYTDNSTNKCMDCPAGYACPSSQAGINIMTKCLPGTYSPGKLTACIVCSPGNYCPSTTASSETSCATGKVSFGGATACMDCPANYECATKFSLQPCPIYFYSLVGTGVCLPCPNGQMCAYQKITTPQLCPIGYYISTLDYTCQTCPVGYSCANGTAAPTICLAGFYQNQIAQATCLACPSGYFSNPGSEYCTPTGAGYQPSSTGQSPCPDKFYSDWGFPQCLPCENGFLCPIGADTATDFKFSCPKGSYCIAGVQNLCPDGYFGLKARARSLAEGCGQCPAGYYCIAGTDNYELYPCPRGAYCPKQTGLPNQCAPGYYNDQLYGKTLADCQLCPLGNECGLGTINRGAVCRQGYYCPQGAAPLQYPCPPGTYGGNRTGLKDQAECIPCPTGSYCPSGTAKPILSPPGYYQPYQSIGDVQALILCPPKYYCPNYGMMSYKGFHCSPGYYCPAGSNSSTQMACPEGTFSDSYEIHDVAHCLQCPRGFKCGIASTSAFNMTDCPLNQYCPDGTKASDVINCPAGSYTKQTLSRSLDDCVPCDTGYYCESGKSPVICPKGSYCPPSTKSATHHLCPAGYYQDQLGSTSLQQCIGCINYGVYCPMGSVSPVPCPNGTYQNFTNYATECKTCPAGTYCPTGTTTGTSVPNNCKEGRYSLQGASECSVCEVGYFCPVQRISNETKAYKLVCPAGLYCYRKVTTSYLNAVVNIMEPVGEFGLYEYPNLRDHACQEGYYCPAGTKIQVPCPPGTYNRIKGRKAITDCVQIDSGYFTNQNASIIYSGHCAPGYYCPTGSIAAQSIACPVGTFRTISDGSQPSDCAICPSGSICDELALVYPKKCPIGFYCAIGSILPEPCPEGTYSNKENLTDSYSCTDCPAGYYCAKKNLTAPQDLCDEGYYCISNSRRPEPTDNVTGAICPAGGYCPRGATQPSSCPAGSFNMFQGGVSTADCAPCWAGYYCQGSNLPYPTALCWAGYYCPIGSPIPTLIAQPGNYAPQGSGQQLSCPRGTYNSLTQQASCQSCPIGYYCPDFGMKTPITCPKGQYCPSYDYFKANNLFYGTIRCPAGTYNPITGQKDATGCLPCPAGKYCESKGLSTFTGSCQAGFFCVAYATSPIPTTLSPYGYFGPCPGGYYCAAGVTAPQPCPIGTFSNQTQSKDSTTCLTCLEGMYCGSTGLSWPSGPCGVGYYCPAGSTTATPTNSQCAAGQYCPQGASYPITCPIGYYQELATQGKCLVCTKGYYCVFGARFVCPVGYICA